MIRDSKVPHLRYIQYKSLQSWIRIQRRLSPATKRFGFEAFCHFYVLFVRNDPARLPTASIVTRRCSGQYRWGGGGEGYLVYTRRCCISRRHQVQDTSHVRVLSACGDHSVAAKYCAVFRDFDGRIRRTTGGASRRSTRRLNPLVICESGGDNLATNQDLDAMRLGGDQDQTFQSSFSFHCCNEVLWRSLPHRAFSQAQGIMFCCVNGDSQSLDSSFFALDADLHSRGHGTAWDQREGGR